MAQSDQSFGRVRSILWPVHGYELKKLVPMVLLFFFILFNYTVLRDTKDTLVVTAPGGGAEVIPFLKFWGVLPSAVIFMLIYAKLSNKLSKPGLFYSVVFPFFLFFALFATVIYPARHSLHPNAFCDYLQSILPVGAKGLIAVVRNWTYSLFYVMSELWGSVALSLLFWGFANDITKVSESKRFYSIFTLFANVSLLIAGWSVRWFSSVRDTLPAGKDPWQVSLNYLMGAVCVSTLLILAIYWWINHYVLVDPRFYNQEEQAKQKKAKPKLSIKESFLYLVRSKYLGCIAILVLSYGIAINLIEVTWKGQLKSYYPDPNAYNSFMGRFSQITGLVTIVIIFFGSNLIRRLGWKRAALITPFVVLTTGVSFFSFVIFKNELSAVTALFGTSTLLFAVVLGAAQNIASKSAKYAFFDPTKEMTYIPLDQEQKVKGKAAVDVVGARLGKSGGALMQQGLILAFGSIAAITPYACGILLFIILAWVITTKSLSKQFLQRTQTRGEEGREIPTDGPTAKADATAGQIPSKT